MQRSEDGPPSKARLHKVAAGRVCDCSAGIGTVFPSKVLNPVSSLGLRGSRSTPTSTGAGRRCFRRATQLRDADVRHATDVWAGHVVRGGGAAEQLESRRTWTAFPGYRTTHGFGMTTGRVLACWPVTAASFVGSKGEKDTGVSHAALLGDMGRAPRSPSPARRTHTARACLAFEASQSHRRAPSCRLNLGPTPG